MTDDEQDIWNRITKNYPNTLAKHVRVKYRNNQFFLVPTFNRLFRDFQENITKPLSYNPYLIIT